MASKTVFITRPLPDVAAETLKKHFTVTVNEKNEPVPLGVLGEAVSRFDAILSTVSDTFTAELLARKKHLEVISNYAVGLNNIDLSAAKKNGIAVYNTPDVVTESTADMTFALLLSLVRKIDSARSFVKHNKWAGWDPTILLGEELHGKTFGIIGFGRIGQAIARRALGFGLEVVYNNASGRKALDLHLEKMTHYVTLFDLLLKADFISIHVPATPSTRHLINAEVISRMKRRPIIINMARGEVVETDALVSALRNGAIRGACLDVTDPEPLSGDHPLVNMENCIVTPHIGTATVECRNAMAKLAAQNIINHFKYE